MSCGIMRSVHGLMVGSGSLHLSQSQIRIASFRFGNGNYIIVLFIFKANQIVINRRIT